MITPRFRAILLALVVSLLVTGCKGCQDAIVQGVVALGKVKFVLTRIAGAHYFELAKKDGGDTFTAQNGFLCVTHNPGCGMVGNNGDDTFFASKAPLPPLCTLVGVDFVQFWPNGISSASGGGGLGGWGSYGAHVKAGPRDGSAPIVVSWNNACQGVFGGKILYYRVSFIVSMPEGTDLGEAMVDQGSTPPVCVPDRDSGPGGPAGPTGPSASGFSGQAHYCNLSNVTAIGKLHIEATCTSPLSGAQGSSSMTEDIQITFSPSGGGVPSVSGFKTALTYKQGTWQITKAQIVGLTGVLPGLPLTAALPGGPGTPVLDFSAGTCTR